MTKYEITELVDEFFKKLDIDGNGLLDREETLSFWISI